ncbi:adenylosuccinate synthetase [Gordonia sp. (in: high G+C Gram-positive bacteria)]|uniref:adenylosuccinate synthetase n=1 Tax=Gordonia sp. (in: high G+C Gram-positive bacteria) TaxID=84139 RepID=UPI002636FC06|nr:adenylosuccinate synthetase [Gordonia sp. (in: high G+C Gram-positive bacteria)]HMS73721.1 adenylosuccinate synthetase [Gordonia sp. (in: high G+C Gram-positive bacteria)]HQV18128.1 adenylosuccinate synthetase [Gordonia sp. (in: high G+C Gram-positive bacteria)]
MTVRRTGSPIVRPKGSPIVVVGLGYGDESKGATVDYLASTIGDTAAVVRWSGGAQAAHNVCHGPRQHTFRQFGSGTLRGVRTILRAPMMVNPISLAAEAAELAALGVGDPLGLVTVDPGALVTTPIHVAMNRAREIARGDGRHGSCGEGIGETRAYALAVEAHARQGDSIGNFPVHADAPASPALTVGMLRDRTATVAALDALADYARPLLDSADHPDATHEPVVAIADALCDIAVLLTIVDDIDAHLVAALSSGTVIFEGSQGVLLDEWFGFHPYTTWSTITPAGLAGELRAAGHRPYVLGLTRSYATRHGAGPMPTEDPSLDLPDVHNREGRYQGGWRTGHLDLPALRYAIRAAGGVDGIGVSHLDAVGTRELLVATGWSGVTDPLPQPSGTGIAELETLTARAWAARPDYRPLPGTPEGVLELIGSATGCPTVLAADGPQRTDRRMLCPNLIC